MRTSSSKEEDAKSLLDELRGRWEGEYEYSISVFTVVDEKDREGLRLTLNQMLEMLDDPEVKHLGLEISQDLPRSERGGS